LGRLRGDTANTGQDAIAASIITSSSPAPSPPLEVGQARHSHGARWCLDCCEVAAGRMAPDGNLWHLAIVGPEGFEGTPGFKRLALYVASMKGRSRWKATELRATSRRPNGSLTCLHPRPHRR
jgi:hypothetical protein